MCLLIRLPVPRLFLVGVEMKVWLNVAKGVAGFSDFASQEVMAFRVACTLTNMEVRDCCVCVCVACDVYICGTFVMSL